MTEFSNNKDEQSEVISLTYVRFVCLQSAINLLKVLVTQIQSCACNALSVRKRDLENFSKKFLKYCATSVTLLLIITRNPFFKPKDNGGC